LPKRQAMIYKTLHRNSIFNNKSPKIPGMQCSHVRRKC